MSALKEAAQQALEALYWGKEVANASGTTTVVQSLMDAEDALRDALAAEPAVRKPDPDLVICPACTHQFLAIPEAIQEELWRLRRALRMALRWQDDEALLRQALEALCTVQPQNMGPLIHPAKAALRERLGED